MTPEKFQLLMDLFQRALALEGESRRRFIDSECGSDEEIRRELEALLGEPRADDHHLVTAGGLEAVRRGGASGRESGGWRGGGSQGGPAPVLSGNYRLLRVLGEGGMGIVYQAEQAFPRRVVALKAMRPGLVSTGLLRRFQNEAQILARLQHPGIAQIYEAGAADEEHADQAFFAMEFVDGRPLTDFARERALGVEQRLQLMIKVCDAVQHAHQRGVIHRDLKPSNILVDTTVDPPQPKILDFGVARAADGDIKGTTLQTGVGQLLGTLPYMSPEQIAADPDAIDTRTDVYALGVILYQMLVGRLPFEVSSRSIAEAARIIRDELPSRIASLDRTFRGDLDTIVAKALEKDKTRRYQSAAELADDLRRFITHEPIAAKRDSLGYVLQRKVRRYRWAVGASVAFAVIMCGFLVHAVLQARELAQRLSIANIERGRALAEGGSMSTAEDVLWREFLQDPDSRRARWALRDVYTRRPVLRTLSDSNLQPSVALASPDGQLVVFTGLRGRAAVWSRDLSHAIWEKTIAENSVSDCVFTPDSRRLVVIVDQKIIRLLDALTGETLREFGAEIVSPSRLALVRGGKSVAISSIDGEAAVYDLATGQEQVRKPITRRRVLYELESSPDDGLIVMGGSDGSLAGWTPDLTKPVWKSSVKGAIGGMHFVEDGRTLVVAGADHRLSWVDPDTGQVLAESPISTEHVRDLTLIDGGRTLAAGGDRFIDLVDIASRKVVRTLSSDPSHHFSVAEGVEVGTLIVAGTAAAAQLWQTSPDPSTSTLNDSPDGWVLGISISGDGSRMVTTDSNGGARLWDLNSWSQMVPRRAVGAVGLRTGVLSHDGELAYFGNVTGEIQVRSGYDLSGVRSIVAFDASVTALDLSPDGRTLVAATFDGKAGLWDAQTGRKLHDLEGKRRQLHFARFTPDSRRVALVGFEPSVSLWDVASGQKLNEISSDTTAFAVAFSPDGAWMAYTGRVRRIEIARTSTLRTERTLEGHSHVPVSLAISPDGEVVAAGAADGTVRLWETRTGGALSTLHISESEISRIAFTRDGRHLIAGSREGTVWKCDLDYFDRYIAGNARYQAERQRDWIPRSTDLTAVFRWADSVLAAPPRAAAVPGKAEPPASAAP